MDKAQAYAVLRIEPGCTEEEIKKAYAALSRQYHPEEYPEEFQQIHDAYRMLRRQEQRQHSIHPVTVTGTKEADSQSVDINALEETEYDNITDHLSGADLEAYAYEFIVDATTEGKMLIKAIAVEDYGDGAPDAVNIKNARKEYVIPGSSLKGAVRNHMEQIAERLHQKTVIKDTFGSAGNGEDLGQSGNIIFRDTIIGDKEDNDRMPNDYRIHIDKFTGGVMNGSLFSEKATAGNVKLHILVKDCNHPEKTSALLILALRDLALGMYNLGSGYSIGRGFLNVKEICINALKDQKHAVIRYVPAGKCDDPDQIITMCLRSLQEVE